MWQRREKRKGTGGTRPSLIFRPSVKTALQMVSKYRSKDCESWEETSSHQSNIFVPQIRKGLQREGTDPGHTASKGQKPGPLILGLKFSPLKYSGPKHILQPTEINI